MRTLLCLLALAGCTADDFDGTPDMPTTLGSGSLRLVRWGEALCPRGFTCAGNLVLGPSLFTAEISNGSAPGDEVARGQLTQSTRDTLDDFVAAIPLATPTGVFEPDGGDAGKVEMQIDRNGEMRTYFTNGFRGDFGVYVADVIRSIDTCATDFVTYDSCTPQH